jgi:putative Mg2+ transporter-C (MgtC) family protein
MDLSHQFGIMVLKLLIAVILGGVIGLEREMHERPAGLRTHALVCLGSALITIISISLYPTGDSGRIAAQIVSGIGFLGAGTILRQGNIVRGLTTAASLWTVAGIGMAVGVGGIVAVLAVVAALIVMLTLIGVKYVEPRLWKEAIERGRHELYFELNREGGRNLERIMNNLKALEITIESCSSSIDPGSPVKSYRLVMMVPHNIDQHAIINMLDKEEGVGRYELA